MKFPIVSFHGGSGAGAINDLIAFPAGEPAYELLSTATPSAVVHPLKELRKFLLDQPGEHLYVANGSKDLNQVLRFGPPVEEGKQWRYECVYASRGLSHPFDLVWGFGGALFVSNQDTNEVTSFDSQGAEGAKFASGFKAVRGLAYDGSRLYVADSGDDRIRAFDADGNEVGHAKAKQPVHLLWDADHGWLLIGSEADDSVLAWNPSTSAEPATLVAKTEPAIDRTAGLALAPGKGKTATLFVASRLGRQVLSFPLDFSSGAPVWSPKTTEIFLHKHQLGDNPEFVGFFGLPYG